MSALDSKPVVLVTGASRGLGHALVHEFATQGWWVASASRQPVSKADLDQVWPIKLEVTSAKEAKSSVEQILEKWKRIDVLINNAGAISDAPIWESSQPDFEKILSVNLKAAFICSQMVLPIMLRQRDGHIINISSFSGRAGARGQTSYAAAKAGLFGLTSSLALEVGSRNIRVNAVLPGVLPTGMTSHLNPQELESFANANALRRINSLDEVARFIVFLATMRNVSGQIFQLDSRVNRWT